MEEKGKRVLKEIHDVLVIRNGALGDTILTLPVIDSLKKAFPSARITGMGNPAILSLAHGYVDGIIAGDIPGLYTLYGRGCSVPKHIEQLLARFDLVVSYSSDPDGIFIDNLKKIGIPWIINGVISPEEKLRTPIMDLLLLPLKKAGIPVSLTSPRVIPSLSDRKFSQKFFQSLPNSGEGLQPIVAIHPGSGSPKKCWPLERFIQLATWAKKRLRAKILLILGPADRRLNESITPFIKSYNPILADQLPLSRLAAILEKSAVYLGNDSGITHLAAAVGTPTLALFGPTDFRIWGPKNEKTRCLPSIYPCAPCSSRQMARCSDPACMESIPVTLAKKELLTLFTKFYCSWANNNPHLNFRRRSCHV